LDIPEVEPAPAGLATLPDGEEEELPDVLLPAAGTFMLLPEFDIELSPVELLGLTLVLGTESVLGVEGLVELPPDGDPIPEEPDPDESGVVEEGVVEEGVVEEGVVLSVVLGLVLFMVFFLAPFFIFFLGVVEGVA
jgi:hypothetical protein